jgi:hypothetical protein
MKSNMFFSVGPNPKTTPRNQYRVDEHGISYMKQNVTAFKGPCIVVAESDDFFGGHESKRYESPVLVDPTWRSMMGVARSAQLKTLDFHHQFLEGVYPTGDKRTVNGVEVTVLRFSLGS